MIAARPFRWGCLLLVALCVVTRAFEALFYVWNDVRFSRAYALAHGMDLYGSSDSGVISGIIYGPVGFLLYAPAALWSTPTPALFTAALISSAATLGPAALVIRHGAAVAGKPSWALPLFTLTALHFHAAAAMAGVWMIHTDAAALGLSCLALYAMLRHPLGKPFSAYLVAAAAAASLAVWAKQTVAPILLIPALYLLLRGTRRGAACVLGLGIAFSSILGTVFSALYGAEDLWRAMITIPSQHARYPGILLHDGARVTEMVEMLCLPLVGLACLMVLEGRDPSTSDPSGSSWPERALKWGEAMRNGHGWPLFAGAALLMLPMACLGRIKAGGSANNYGLVDYFLSLGLVMLFLTVAARPSLAGKRPRRALEGAMAVLLVWLAIPGRRGSRGAAVRCVRPPTGSFRDCVSSGARRPGNDLLPLASLGYLNGRGALLPYGVGRDGARSGGTARRGAAFSGTPAVRHAARCRIRKQSLAERPGRARCLPAQASSGVRVQGPRPRSSRMGRFHPWFGELPGSRLNLHAEMTPR